MLIGYARVSTNDQETATQVAALKALGASASFERRHPAVAEIGLNYSGSSIDSARVTCLWFGNWIGYRVPFETSSRSWSGSGKPEPDSVA